MTVQCDVLITYGWCRSSYTALRSLRRLGLRVAVADSGRVGMSQWSRLRACAGLYAPPLTEPEAFVADVARLLRQTGARFLLPGHDETEILAGYRAQLPAHVCLPVADAAQLVRANDKAQTAMLAAELGLPVPQTIRYSSLVELNHQLRDRSQPLVVKLRRGNGAKGVFYPDTPAAAVQLCADLIDQYRLAPTRFPIVQERIHGEGWGVSCLYWQGQRLASFTHRRLREKTTTGGTSTMRISARNVELEAMAHRLLDRLNWHGLAMVEFKYDPAAKQGWFIEINPRLWGSIHLAVSAGVDFPVLLYLAATQGVAAARQQVRPYQTGVVARWYLGDLIVAAGQLRQGRAVPALKLLWPGGTDTLDDWYWDDPTAFVGQAAYYLATFLKMRSLNPVKEGMLG
ncbi:MAG TPA: ATP-grasp domain-containing protein [Anaerolineae bacterium]|nr:ATP-grasp domain-containing protein [Anaerolineae bacterium]